MSTKLELTEPIRKAMARRLCDSLGLDEEVGLYEVDHMIAAANSIPELPVGTIALRPDGKWVGVRDNKRRGVPWLYCPLSDSAADWPALRAADSWRVIHNPTNPGCPECSNYAAVGLELVEKLAAAEGARLALEEIVSKCKCGADSKAQQEPPGCGIGLDGGCEGRCRAPRVVDRLGVDERDAEWTRIEVCRDTYVWEYRFRHGVWKYRQLGHKNWIAMKPGDEPLASGPFTEVIE